MLMPGSTGNYHFSLVATNGRASPQGQSYESKTSALTSIELVKQPTPNVKEVLGR